MTDKFQIIETAPLFTIATSGSYESKSFKNAYKLKTKNLDTGSTVLTSGILNCNLKTVPTAAPVPMPIDPAITILQFSRNLFYNSFEWAGYSWNLDNTLPNYSYTANATNLTGNTPNISFLTDVIIGTSVTSIGNDAFKNCTNLSSITIGTSVTSIGNSAFKNCYELSSITLPISVTYIDDAAFYNSGLLSITLPNLLTHIGANAFYNCLEFQLGIPISVIYIGENAFQNSGISRVNISSDNSLGIPSPYDNVLFYGVYVETMNIL